MQGLDASKKAEILARFKHSVGGHPPVSAAAVPASESVLDFTRFPKYRQIKIQKAVAEGSGIPNPFFRVHDGLAKARCQIDGRSLLNFSTYDYLGYNGDPRVNAAVVKAMECYGTSPGASRLVAGELPLHRELEEELAAHYGTEDALCFVSGHATNLNTIISLFCQGDIVFHDSLAHNSIVLGASESGAVRVSYPHNDMQALRSLLKQHRSSCRRALIVTEGVFSMDGNIAALPELVALKEEFSCFLMVDEAHALGVAGKTGRGSFEHYGLDPRKVDIWMGTLSKTLCACGGYIAGCRELIELLKHTAPGFVYSVGLSPVLTAAALQALKLLHQEPFRVERLQHNCRFALECAQALGLNTGRAQATAVLPIIAGSSIVAGYLAKFIYEHAVYALPIIYPVVEEGAARIRLFLSYSHTEGDIEEALKIIASDLKEAKRQASKLNAESAMEQVAQAAPEPQSVMPSGTSCAADAADGTGGTGSNAAVFSTAFPAMAAGLSGRAATASPPAEHGTKPQGESGCARQQEGIAGGATHAGT